MKGRDRNMTDVEILKAARDAALEEEAVSRQLERLANIGAPKGVAGQALTGMPRGTNDPEASRRQQYDGLMEKLLKLQVSLLHRLYRFFVQFEHVCIIRVVIKDAMMDGVEPRYGVGRHNGLVPEEETLCFFIRFEFMVTAVIMIAAGAIVFIDCPIIFVHFLGLR